MRRQWVALAGASAGLGFWASLAAVDVTGTAADVVRVAMLPPLWLLVVSVLTGVTAALAFLRGSRADAAWPLFGAGILALPLLPWLPDTWPALLPLAGPARTAVWFIVGWLIAVQLLADRAQRVTATTPVLIFVLTAGIYGGVAWHVSGSGMFPGGDEPHYLVITQSLITDGDLAIENNHDRGDYRAYFNGELQPHYLTRGVDGEIYSVHPVGLSILALPAFAMGGYPGVVALMVLMAALAATLLWTWAHEVTGSTAAATFAWIAAALTAPYLFNAFTVFPEIPGALAVMLAVAWRPASATTVVLIARGVAIGVLPWLSTKYAPMALALGLVVMARSVRSVRALVALSVPAGLAVAAWFTFFYVYWGTWSPSAPYGAQRNMSLDYLARGAPGLLFDQEYGVMALAPVLILALTGLGLMLRTKGAPAWRALEVLFVFCTLLVTVGAFHIWWGGSASPGRPVASALLLLGLPVAWTFARVRTSDSSALRAGCHVLLAVSVSIAIVFVAVRQGALLNNGRDGSATLLEWLSPAWPAWPAFPSFVVGPVATALGKTAAWLAFAGVIGLVVRSVGRRGFAVAGLVAITAGAVGAVVIASTLGNSPGPAPDARARNTFLDDFDAGRRPIGVIYDPWTRTSPADVLSRIRFASQADMPSSGSTASLLWNTRLALPAGVYRLLLSRDTDAPGELGLQLGRDTALYEQWPVEGRTFQREFVVPVDAAFVGFRTTPDFGNGDFTVSPVAVVDRTRRPAAPDVIRTSRYGDLRVLFHDDRIGPEPGGYWTRSGRTYVSFTMPAGGPDTLVLRVGCGPIANRVTLSTRDWNDTVDVTAGEQQPIAVPMPLDPVLGQRVASARIAVRDAFSPSSFDATSRDSRLLGCWFDIPEDVDQQSTR